MEHYLHNRALDTRDMKMNMTDSSCFHYSRETTIKILINAVKKKHRMQRESIKGNNFTVKWYVS